MFSFFRRRPEVRRFIDRGRVHCEERNGDVDLDACCTCRWREDIVCDARHPYVVCSPRPEPFLTLLKHY